MEEAVFSAPGRKAWHRDRRQCPGAQLVVAFPQPTQSFAEADADYSRCRARGAEASGKGRNRRVSRPITCASSASGKAQTIFCSAAMRMSCTSVRALNFVRSEVHVVATVL